MTAQGHSRSIFTRAIENGNLLVAEMTAREVGRLTLDESLALTTLIAEREPERSSRFVVRWLRRLHEGLERQRSLRSGGSNTAVRVGSTKTTCPVSSSSHSAASRVTWPMSG